MNLTVPNDFQELTDSQLHTAFQRGVTGSEKLFTVQTNLTFHNKLTFKAEWLLQCFKGNKRHIWHTPCVCFYGSDNKQLFHYITLPGWPL
jgi:hypothetical protein